MLTIKQVTIQDLKNHILLEDFSFSLGKNDKVGIIGEEGNGKSTLLKAIYNRKLIEEYTVMRGEIDTDYKNIGYLEQQLNPKWNECMVYEYLLKNDVMDTIEFEQYNDLKYYETLCGSLNMRAELLQSSQTCATLSGGEKVKLQLLKLMGTQLDLLLLDEPTNDLDIATLQWLEDFICNLRIPVMFVSHDEKMLNKAANVILHLEQLNKKTKSKYTIYRGNYDQYHEERGLKYAKEVQNARKEKREYIKKKQHLNDIQNAVHDAMNDCVRAPFQAALLAKKMRNVKAQEKRFEREGFAHVDSVEEAIAVRFNNTSLPKDKIIFEGNLGPIQVEDRRLLQQIHLSLRGKDKAVILGDNGCGKSLLMKEIYRILKKRDDILIGYMPQSYTDFFKEEDTPISFLLESGDRYDVTRSRELLGRMKFTTEEMEHSIKQLSEGQKAKLYLLKFIKSGCNVLLLDEPTRNLSPLSRPAIYRLLKEFNGCILAVSHDRRFITEVFDLGYCIRNQEWFSQDMEVLKEIL